jgi:hypothetical protein
LIEKDKQFELEEYRKDLLKNVDEMIEKQIEREKGTISEEERLNHLIKKEYQLMIRLYWIEKRTQGQRERNNIYLQLQKCKEQFGHYFNQRKAFPDPPTERDVTNPESKFWATFSDETNDFVKETIAAWKVLHSFDRLNEEKEMLEKELQNIRHFQQSIYPCANDTSTNTNDIYQEIDKEDDIDKDEEDVSDKDEDVSDKDEDDALDALLDLLDLDENNSR